MHRLRLLSITALLAVIGFFASNLHASQSPGWGVVVATNAFVAHGKGNDLPIATGASVGQGDRLTTKPGGAIVLSRGEDLVTMAENSQIVITDPQPLNATLIQQPAGNVQYHVTHKSVPHFEVDTPLLATVVKGTTFSVSTGPGGSSVTVKDGRVVAKDRRSGSASSVGTGERGSVDSGHGGVSVRTVASAGTTSSTASSPSSGNDGSSDSGSDDSSGNSGKGASGSGNSGSGSGNSGSGNSNSGSGNSGSSSGSNGNGNSGDGNSDNGNGGSNGNGGGNGKGNKNGQHDGKGKNG